MKKIGLLSDTHGFWDEKYETHFAECDEIWHAGDIGSFVLAQRFEAMKPFRAVYGNVDSDDVRRAFPHTQRFALEGVEVMMTHIGGYPGHYNPAVFPQLCAESPKLFIAGHSHILKVMYDETLECLYMNPGAASKYGIHRVRTLLRFVLDDGNIRDLEVIEIGKLG
jgi:putative phosphoesterase